MILRANNLRFAISPAELCEGGSRASALLRFAYSSLAPDILTIVP
jgi:hypothetical protein